jgi:hypothetical protein
MNKNPNVQNLGEVAVFYLPSKKINKKIRNKIHDFLIKNYEAYTHESSNIKGYWVNDNCIVKDIHERYEVSFKGKVNFKRFIVFISEICKITKEDAIYLTFANKSYLIKP